MLNICHITSAHPRYDIRIFIKECCTLATAGHNVSLIVADDKADEMINDVNIYSVGKPISRSERMKHIPLKIYNKIIKLKPDIVHFHDPELMLIGLKLTKKGFKVVYDVHEDLPKQVRSKHWIPTFIRPLVSTGVAFLERYHVKRFYGVIAATPLIAKRFERINLNTITVCNYPILSELKIINSNWGEREDKLCYIGSISLTRGIKPIVESLELSNIGLELAGPFSGDISLTDLQQLPAGAKVNYLGVIDRTQIIALLQKVKIGLVTLFPTPSYIESLPIKMFEYMLAGIPVVASNFPLWEEIITKHSCGVLVDPTNSEAIASACNMLLDNDELAQEMGINGQKAVLEFFNWEKESIKLCQFYQNK